MLGRAPHGAWPERHSDVILPTPPGRLDYVMASWGRDLLPCREGRSVCVCVHTRLHPCGRSMQIGENSQACPASAPGQLPHPCPKCLFSLVSCFGAELK